MPLSISLQRISVSWIFDVICHYFLFFLQSFPAETLMFAPPEEPFLKLVLMAELHHHTLCATTHFFFTKHMRI